MKTPFIFLFVFLLTTTTYAETDLKLGLNWKAESEFGGFYAAEINNIYKKHGLKVQILEGGAGTPTIQMLSAGTIDFGIISADELVIARAQKQPLVAVYATFQKSPYVLMAHASKGYKSLDDLFKSNSTISMIKGLPYVAYLEKKYGFKTVKVVPYAGGITNFIADENFAQQGFVSSEPLLAQKKGIKTSQFLVSDSGFNPYVVVLATQEKLLKDKPEIVQSMVTAVREGWTAYLKSPASTQQHIAKLNPTMDTKTQADMFKIEKNFIQMEKSSKAPLGTMTESRWSTLIDQLFDLKLIKEKPKATDLFVNF